MEWEEEINRVKIDSYLIQRIAYANMLNTIFATLRLCEIARIERGELILRRQLNQILQATRKKYDFLCHEGIIAIQYWKLYKALCLKAGFRMRSRVLERFVPVHLRPYAAFTQISSAINCLHSLRLNKCLQIDSEVFGKTLPGFLHKRKWQAYCGSNRFGFTLDTFDSLKLIDRELLLKSCIDRLLSPLDFDRDLYTHYGYELNEYYYAPKPKALKALREISAKADTKTVYIAGQFLPSTEAYRKQSESLRKCLFYGNHSEFKPILLHSSKTELGQISQLIKILKELSDESFDLL